MQTQVLPKTSQGVLYLEFLDQATGNSTKTMIVDFPFIIGRNATCDLTVESGRVSREHAEIIRHGTGYLIRDLRSTNGTSINGEEIEEHILADGDTVSIADFEFDFHCPTDESARQTVTLSMEDRQRAEEKAEVDPAKLVQSLRTVSGWSALSQIDPKLRHIESLQNQSIVGSWCPLFSKGYHNAPEWESLGASDRLENHLRRLQHSSALFSLVEQSPQLVIVEMDQADLDRADFLESLGWMKAQLGATAKIAVGATVELLEASILHPTMEQLKAMGVQLAAVNIDQFKPMIVSDVFQHTKILGVSPRALAAASRSPAVAANIQEFIKDNSGSGHWVLAQAGTDHPNHEVLLQLGFHAILQSENH